MHTIKTINSSSVTQSSAWAASVQAHLCHPIGLGGHGAGEPTPRHHAHAVCSAAFVSDLGFLCLLAASREQKQARMSAYT